MHHRVTLGEVFMGKGDRRVCRLLHRLSLNRRWTVFLRFNGALRKIKSQARRTRLPFLAHLGFTTMIFG